MGELIYATNVTLDGYIADEHGAFDWLPADDEVFAAHTDLMRSVGTLLYGRRLYEMMAVWEVDPALAAQSSAFAEFSAVWRGSAKIVYSTTLREPVTARTRVEGVFDPGAVRAITAAADHDLLIGGADLAAQALATGLVDEIRLFVFPILVGGGTPGLPTGVRAGLDLLEERRFGNGVVLVRYRVRRS